MDRRSLLKMLGAGSVAAATPAAIHDPVNAEVYPLDRLPIKGEIQLRVTDRPIIEYSHCTDTFSFCGAEMPAHQHNIASRIIGYETELMIFDGKEWVPFSSPRGIAVHNELVRAA